MKTDTQRRRHRGEDRHTFRLEADFWIEWELGFEPRTTDLQSNALPLSCIPGEGMAIFNLNYLTLKCDLKTNGT